MVGSAWNEFGPELSKSWTAGSATRSCQSVVQRSKPYRSAASATASSERPAIETSSGRSGGHVVGEGAVGVRVRLPHEGVAEHADADRVRQVGDAAGDGLGHVGLEAAHETSALNC